MAGRAGSERDAARTSSHRGSLASMVGVSQPAIAKIESGKVKNLQLKTLVKYAATLGGQVWIQIVEDASVSGSRNGDTAKWRPAQSHRNRFRSAEDRRTLPGKIALPCRLAL